MSTVKNGHIDQITDVPTLRRIIYERNAKLAELLKDWDDERAEHAQERARLLATVAALILKWRVDAAQEQRVSFCADELEQTLAETATKGTPT